MGGPLASETDLAAGMLGRAVLVMSQLSRYGVGVLRLDLDDSSSVSGAELSAVMLDSSVPDDPNIRLLTVKPDDAEFWDGPGKIIGTIKMVAAAATNTRPNYGENRKVAM